MRRARPGFAMPIAVVTIVILLAMGTGLLALGFNSRVYSIRTATDITARCAADTGLTIALFELNKKLDETIWSDDSLPAADGIQLLNCDATCSYRVTGNSSSGYTIQSLGQAGDAHRSVEVTVRLASAFEHAILTKNDLTLKASTIVDAYDSSNPSATGLSLSIGSQSIDNDSVVLNMGVVVNGDVVVGPGGDTSTAIKDLGATLDSKYTAGLQPLPNVTAPSMTTRGSISVKGVTTSITPSESGQYSSISLTSTGVTKPGVLEVSGGDVVLHVTGDIDLGNSAEIIVKDGSTLTLYVDGDIVTGNGSSISHEGNPQEPAVIKLYGTSTDKQYFDVKAKADWTGVIYAPNADVDMYAGADVYGAVVADSFDFKYGGDFHYDKALSEGSVNDEAVIFVVSRWSEGQAKSFD